MNIDIIVGCDRCGRRALVSAKGVSNEGIRDIIVRNSKWQHLALFGIWFDVVCETCQADYAKEIERREQEAKDFLDTIQND